MAEKQKKLGLFPGREVLGPLFLTVTPPVFSIAMWYTNFHLGGDFVALGREIMDRGFVTFFKEVWPTPFDPLAWKIILGFMAFQLAVMRLVPGKQFKATMTKTGHVPVYTANGVQCYLVSIATFFALAHFGYIRPAVVYDMFGELVSAMNLFSLLFVLMLTIKGLYFPSTKDSGTSGNFVIDYYWGTELYPRIFGWDVKVFTNCRFGLMYWQLGLFCYCYKQYEDLGYVTNSLLVCTALQTIYLFKFYVWETGYFCSMDIQHDRAGFYICWGCLVWVPVAYTSHGYFMVKQALDLPWPLAIFFFLAGVLSIYINYDSDRQRQQFRASEGKMKIWGKEPEYIAAQYTTEDGKTRGSLLLRSGWWGISRHFHYVPEIMAAFFWSVPALFTHFMPYFYVTFLTLLLTDRAFRDDARCAKKYGKYWDEYKKHVPYYIIPGII